MSDSGPRYEACYASSKMILLIIDNGNNDKQGRYSVFRVQDIENGPALDTKNYAALGDALSDFQTRIPVRNRS